MNGFEMEARILVVGDVHLKQKAVLPSGLAPIGDGSMLLVEGRSVRAVTDDELGLEPWPFAVSEWVDASIPSFG